MRILLFTLMRIRIQLYTVMRIQMQIRIQLPKIMRIREPNPDPDPQDRQGNKATGGGHTMIMQVPVRCCTQQKKTLKNSKNAPSSLTSIRVENLSSSVPDPAGSQRYGSASGSVPTGTVTDPETLLSRIPS
jgi:hypothetical protein